jgi:ubiquinone/menaquinone biosynthesis C-methylase UbiE
MPKPAGGRNSRGVVRLSKRRATSSGSPNPGANALYRRIPELPEDWGEVAALYDIEQPSCRGDEARFWHDEAVASGASNDRPVVELAAGSGRVAIAVARKGHSVIGVDLSERMIARAVGRTARLPEATRARLRWIKADMATVDLGTVRPSMIFVAFNSFWLLDDATQDLCLARLRNVLAPDGRLVLDLFPPTDQDYTDEDGITQFLGRRWHGRSVLRVKDYRYDRSTNRASSDVRYYSTDRDRGSPAAMLAQFRYVLHPEAPDRVVARLANAGFAIEAQYGTYGRGPLEADSPRAIFTASVASRFAPSMSVDLPPSSLLV